MIEQGPRKAENVLVLVPGTSGGAAYFRPMARAIVGRLPGWKVWSVDRRENRLEDHSVLGPVVGRDRPAQDAFRYYLESLTDTSITPRFAPVADAPYARRWGMGVAVRDLRNVIRAARRGGRTVVLGGHSLGATIAIAYATWDFRGRAGAEDLAGLVLIDGGSGGAPIRRSEAREQLEQLGGESPFLDLSGFGPPNLALVRMHIGGLAAAGDPRPWADGELGTVARAAETFSGIVGIDGTARYHPRRLSIDGQAVAGGVANPAQRLLGVRAPRRAATSGCRSTRSRRRSAPAAC